MAHISTSLFFMSHKIPIKVENCSCVLGGRFASLNSQISPPSNIKFYYEEEASKIKLNAEYGVCLS